jgi:hypothetical protein
MPFFTAILMAAAAAAVSPDDVLPPGVRAVWDLDKSHREKTATRERVCLNGLWRWQPSKDAKGEVPADRWGWFKVPGGWPGLTDYMQKDCQTVHPHSSWKGENLGGVTAAWYQREVSVPADWTGRRLAVTAETLNSFATVFVDGKKAGEMRFPSGEVDLSSACRPGGKHVLSMLVLALPLQGVMLSHSDTNTAREVKGTVRRRGLCGDVFLVGEPAGPRIADVKVDPSVQRGEVSFEAGIQGLDAAASYVLRAEIADGSRAAGEFRSPAFKGADLKEGRFAFTAKWKPEKLWDLHTPGHQQDLRLSLLDPAGKALDAALPVRFGFREFWIEGRDFFLNGTRIFLSSVPLDNAQVGAAWASYEGAKESLLRLRSFGINFVYTHNYGCEPGSHLGFAEILRAADDVGMLVAFSQPHFAHYDWIAPDADASNGYARHAEFFVRAAQNHPSVVFYAMSHNATGYGDDMNPDLIDGLYERRSPWAVANAKKALRAEALVKRLDPSRIVYHHSSGNLGSMHTSNFYPNWAPIQELSDWFETWATKGVKPVFTCEYGAPFTWDWAMYRGWYKGQRTFGSARVPWEFCLAEWNAQFLGDAAFRVSEQEKKNLRWEAKQFRSGGGWFRWDYPHQLGSRDFDERFPIMARYIEENWRAFRTWGVSANSPWEHSVFWKLRDGMDRNRREDLKVDWDHLQRPGFSADYVQDRYECLDLAYARSDWVPTAAAEALIRNNGPFLAYIAGKPARFTSKDHLFLTGEAVEKQVVVINNSRQTASAEVSWSFGLPQPVTGNRKVSVATGQQERIPLKFDLPAALAPGKYMIQSAVTFAGGEIQKDSFEVHVLPRTPEPKISARIALFDPKGETAKTLGVPFKAVEAGADLSPFEVLVVGKGALTVDGPGPDLGRVGEGLKVVVFEQTAEALEKRLGFRVSEYGLRQVFPRAAGHPVLAGLDAGHLRDWRGEATILPPRLKYELSAKLNEVPAVRWCDLEVSRVWRCGCRGNVASVLIEKPARGDFMPVVDGGFGLQYSPLLEYREGRGMVLFCQMDVTGRTENDPAAETLLRNILRYVDGWKSRPSRKVVYAGEAAGKGHLEAAGFPTLPFEEGILSPGHVLVVGPGGAEALGGRAAGWIKSGGPVLAVGLDEKEANAFLPFKVGSKKGEHIATFFELPAAGTPLAGIGPADVHNRDPRELSLIASGAAVLGDGVLARAEGANVVFSQLAPWQFGYKEGQFNVKRTFRRTSSLLARLLGNLGASGSTPLLSRFRTPVERGRAEKRWLEGLYLDVPEEWDDPYRFFRW